MPDPIQIDPRAVADDLYDLFREARLNVKYYGSQLAWYQRCNLAIEISIAIGTSATLLSLPLTGKVFAAIFGTLAALCGVVKPLLSIPRRIERASKLWSGYTGVFVSAQSLARAAKFRKSMDVVGARALQDLHDRMDVLCLEDDPCPKETELKRFEEEVRAEFPPDEFWWPDRAAA